MRTLAIANQKGGVGKSTTAVNLAAALAEQRQRVLLIDLDAQATATSWLRVAPAPGLADVFMESGNTHLSALAINTHLSGVSAIPADPRLIGVETATAGQVGRECAFRDALRTVRGFDWVLLDTPPALGLVSVSALTAAQGVLVPVEARGLGMAGLAALLDTVGKVRDRLNAQLALVGVLVCRVVHTRLSREVEARLRERFGAQVFAATVPESARLAEAPGYQQSILDYAGDSPAAEAFRAVARELRKRVP